MSKLLFTLFFLAIFNSAFQAQNAEHEIKDFLQNNAHAIKLSDTSDFSDLAFFDTLLKGKKIVLLGEFNHGAKEIFLVKNRLIRYLHKELGYNVLLMESGVGEMMEMNDSKDSMTANQLVFSGLMGPWCTEEFAELIEWFKNENSLYIGGYDAQKTGSSFAKILIPVLEKIDAEKALQAKLLEAENGVFVREGLKGTKDSVMTKTYGQLVGKYENLAFFLDKKDQKLIDLGVEKIKLQLIQQTIKNRIGYLNYYYQFKIDNDWSKRFAARDALMAENVVFFVEELFPNEKIIISGHNYHISKYSEKELTMGEKLAEKYSDEMLSIGFFGGNGEYASNSRKPNILGSPIKENDLRKIMLLSNNEVTFLNVKSTEKGGEWINQAVIITDSFINLYNDENLNLKRTFDALIFIKNVSLPVYLKRDN